MYHSLLDYIGNTPMVELNNIRKEFNLKSHIYAKVEMFNPSGSIKARIAKNMIIKALEKNVINKDTVIIESTSGNTGVGLAFVCACLGMRFIATMPETMSIERQKLIKAYGGEIVLTKKELGMKGAVDEAIRLKEQLQNAFIPSQFENENNPLTHYEETGVEILNQCHNINVLVAGIGTGGTISGIGRRLKETKEVKVVGAEPLSSPLINLHYAGPHKIQGIGANFIPHTLNLNYVDEVKMVSDDDAFTYSRLLAKKEGLFVGISSGCALKAGLDYLKEHDDENNHCVIILPDTGERYLSTDLVK